jgi:hypothetical protein
LTGATPTSTVTTKDAITTSCLVLLFMRASSRFLVDEPTSRRVGEKAPRIGRAAKIVAPGALRFVFHMSEKTYECP